MSTSMTWGQYLSMSCTSTSMSWSQHLSVFYILASMTWGQCLSMSCTSTSMLWSQHLSSLYTSASMSWSQHLSVLCTSASMLWSSKHFLLRSFLHPVTTQYAYNRSFSWEFNPWKLLPDLILGWEPSIFMLKLFSSVFFSKMGRFLYRTVRERHNKALMMQS